MILLDNKLMLKKKFPLTYENLNRSMLNSENNVIIEPTKNGMFTLKILGEERYLYVHSKYNPLSEAEIFMNQFQDLETFENVLFIGTGLGYHITVFLQKNKYAKFSIFEPNPQILNDFLSQVKLNSHESRIEEIFTDISQLKDPIRFSKNIGDITKSIILPSIEKYYEKEIQDVLSNIIKILKLKQNTVTINTLFQKRWVINSLKNFPKLMETPNIFLDIDSNFIKDKPVIIVAAGPSLSYEFDNLKYIKDNGLAYIFSVGSAINSLIEKEIVPDATLSYDPTGEQYKVLEKLKNKKMNIPLIFGSSVGFETLLDYKGPMIHVITSQDSVSSNLLDTSLNIDIVFDSPSIAILTFQLLTVLKVSKIILVGQNFGYLENKRYAEGIDYDFIENELNSEERKQIVYTDGVNGEKVQSSQSFLLMKRNLEYYVKLNPEIEVINTTIKGAKIEGTSFKSLDEVITENLVSKNVVIENWFKVNSSYDKDYISKKCQELNVGYKKIYQSLNTVIEKLDFIKILLNKNAINKLEHAYVDLDKEFNNLKQNIFYISILEPMIRVQNEALFENSIKIKSEQNVRKKAKLVLMSFEGFIDVVKLNYEIIKLVFEEFKSEMKEKGVAIND